nr:putative glutaredoxin family protein [Tanacetum cinerariifolium]
MILKFFRVTIDERDISMDAEYRKELLLVLSAKNVSLPQVFVRGKHIGGADVVKQLHETGQLATIFVPCANCSGSKKVFDEDDDMLKRCPDCNENGLIRCPSCCS